MTYHDDEAWFVAGFGVFWLCSSSGLPCRANSSSKNRAGKDEQRGEAG